MMHDLVIRGGVTVSALGCVRQDVALDDGAISALGTGLDGRAVIDASDCYVIPGAVDQHVHLQLSLGGLVSTDDFATGTIAAACGGTTTVIDFVHPEAGQRMADALHVRQGEAEGRVAIDYGLHMAIPAWHAASQERLIEVPAMVKAGCATFKMYQAYPNVMLDDAALYRAMRAVAKAGAGVVLHAETGPVLDLLREDALAAGRTAAIEHERTRPARLEASAVHRAAEIAYQTGCRVLVFHVGNGPAVQEITAARARGVAIWGETCPHYLVLTAEKHLDGEDGNLYICAPPLRSAAEQERLWEALREGELQVVSTDHCPWTRAEKARENFTQVPGGVPGIEARLALVHHFGVAQGRISVERWVEVCCEAPARLMGLERKGRIETGMDADIVVFDPRQTKLISRKAGSRSLHEAADWTPYEGVEVTGWPRTVLLRGETIVKDEVYIGRAGDGRFVKRGAPLQVSAS